MRKKVVGISILLLCIGIGTGCLWLTSREKVKKNTGSENNPEILNIVRVPKETMQPENTMIPTILPEVTPVKTEAVGNLFIDPEGKTLETRIQPPDGYTRTREEADSLGTFLRTYELKEDQAKVLHYDGSLKVSQAAHVAVFRLPLENRNLQQCADSIIRIYTEYYWKQKDYNKIAFHFTNGFLAEYSKWIEGYRIKVNGNKVSWVKSTTYDDSYETFVKYLHIVFNYAGTMSMEQESEPISPDKIQIGDIFIKGGSPGHVVMVVDMCENEKGEKAFLLAQGFMPAQEFHVLKNPDHENDPWYYVKEISFPFYTPQYSFEEGSLRHLNY